MTFQAMFFRDAPPAIINQSLLLRQVSIGLSVLSPCVVVAYPRMVTPHYDEHLTHSGLAGAT